VKRKKNFRQDVEVGGEDLMIEVDETRDPNEWPLWYDQYSKLDESKKKAMAKRALEQIKEAKPETYNFIQKFKCEIVGVSPRVEYALSNSNEGDTNVTWVHSFSMPTLLFWCPAGAFGFFVNPILDFNDTVLNKIDGNPKQRGLRGFTG